MYGLVKFCVFTVTKKMVSITSTKLNFLAPYTRKHCLRPAICMTGNWGGTRGRDGKGRGVEGKWREKREGRGGVLSPILTGG